ncbi:hypothetical protein FE394_14560 [Xenorhabdus sp. Reich]|uniref:Uncharacterized protein n=1 Tax=Xenorhabdus littoralis TaxID=2582835 RepID=A0ABU4SP00_9GAMM|nr:hypothetical protein [Xenorhabdus sp. Reich]
MLDVLIVLLSPEPELYQFNEFDL